MCISDSAGLQPFRLLAKEGLSLINGTRFMAAQGALLLVLAKRLAHAAGCACALSLEALQGSRNSFIPQVHELRPLRGQLASARNIMRLLQDTIPEIAARRPFTVVRIDEVETTAPPAQH